MNGTESCLEGNVRPFLDKAGEALVSEYFTTTSFSGRAFDSLGGRGDAPWNRHRFGPEDIVAVSLLGVDVPGHAALAVLDTNAAELNSLLAEIPCDLPLYDSSARSHLDAGAPADELWKKLTAIPDIKWVTAAKLLARKRPMLLPVYDSVVKDALQPDHNSFWLPLWQEFQQDSTLIGRLEEMRSAAGLGDGITLVRVLDVAIWMRNWGIRRVPEEDRGDIEPLPFSRCPFSGD
jgi:hypothetical protein